VNPCPGCTACGLSKTRKRMVESRGSTPADVLVLVESPTLADEATGKLLSGQEGKLLVRMLFEAGATAGVKEYTTHVAPVLFCRPADSAISDNRVPTAREILMCMRNVMRIVTAVNPRLVVLVGPVVKEYYADELPESVYILAPWFLLKQPARYNTNMRNLAEAIRTYVK
jgi:uracil-DNA glycosylase family 4